MQSSECGSYVCRWACLRSTQRSQSPCHWRPRLSSCGALSPTQIAVPPLWTCSPTSSWPSPAARKKARVASQVGPAQFRTTAKKAWLMSSSCVLPVDLLIIMSTELKSLKSSGGPLQNQRPQKAKERLPLYICWISLLTHFYTVVKTLLDSLQWVGGQLQSILRTCKAPAIW